MPFNSLYLLDIAVLLHQNIVIIQFLLLPRQISPQLLRCPCLPYPDIRVLAPRNHESLVQCVQYSVDLLHPFCMIDFPRFPFVLSKYSN